MTFVLHCFVYLASHPRRPPVFLAGLTPIPLPPSSKSFPLNPFADPRTVNPYAAILYKKVAGEGPSQRAASLKFFPCHRSENSPVSPAVATDPKTPYRKSFSCHTSETPGPVTPTYFQKRLRPSRSDGGSCEKGAPSSGEKIESTALQSPKAIDCLAVKGTEGELSCPREAEEEVRPARL